VTDFVRSQLEATVETIRAVQEDGGLQQILIAAAKHTAKAMASSKKLMVAGNGGSAADAQHLVAEFVSRMTVDRPAMRAIAITTDTSILTAVSNDYGFDLVFQRQIEALGLAGDVFVAISTSGRSSNIIKALQHCRKVGITTIGLTGLTGENESLMEPWCDYFLAVPSSITHNIQEAHLALEHIYCQLTERFYFGAERFASAELPAVATA
jgi:D-sedoheptulose 7-phosphate isomerase